MSINILQRTKNLLNKSKSTSGKYINSSGTVATNAGFGLSITEKIYISPSTTYTFSGMGNVQGTSVSRTGYQYNSSGTPLMPIPPSNGEAVAFTTHSNAAYVMLQYVSTQTQPMLEQGSSATSYVPYYEAKKVSASIIKNSAAQKVKVNLYTEAPTPSFDTTFGNNSPSVIAQVSETIASQNMSATDVYNTYGWSL